jgi:hypothetical protein
MTSNQTIKDNFLWEKYMSPLLPILKKYSLKSEKGQ